MHTLTTHSVVILVALGLPVVSLAQAQPVASSTEALPLETCLERMDALFKAYQASGSSPDGKRALLDFFAAQDSHLGENAIYLQAKATHLHWLDEPEAAEAALEKVPDAALTDGSHIFNRLQKRFGKDLDASLLLARKLGSDTDPLLTRRLVRWVHQVLAQRYAPKIQDRARTPWHETFLSGLGDPSYPIVVQVTAGRKVSTTLRQ